MGNSGTATKQAGSSTFVRRMRTWPPVQLGELSTPRFRPPGAWQPRTWQAETLILPTVISIVDRTTSPE